jgi:hypothetical protein
MASVSSSNGMNFTGNMERSSAGMAEWLWLNRQAERDAVRGQKESRINREFTASQAAQDRAADAARGHQGTQAGLDRTAAGQKADSDRSFAATQADSDRTFQGGQNQADRDLQFKLGMAPVDFAREKFNTLSPLLTGLIGNQTGPGTEVGGTSTPLPQINQGPIWSPQQVNQQVNAAKGSNSQMAASQQQQAATKTAAQGFGSRSPLLAALQGQIGASQMAANTDAERNIRFDTAKDNAKHTLDTQVAGQNQWMDANSIDVERRKAKNQHTSALAGILAGLA